MLQGRGGLVSDLVWEWMRHGIPAGVLVETGGRPTETEQVENRPVS